MPNTLAHLGVQTLCSKVVFRDSDFRWIAAGCIVPDLPWIVQRIVLHVVPGTNLLALRIYCLIQASLFFCLLFAAALGLLTEKPLKIFLLLAFNALFHLLLDALQIKWANGVHFLAPFSWQMTSFQLFWPEGTFSYALTCVGLLTLLFYTGRDLQRPVIIHFVPFSRSTASLVLIIYLLLPFCLFQGPRRADNHYVATLGDHEHRIGKPIEIDRCYWLASRKAVKIYSGEILNVTGITLKKNSILSLQGVFTAKNTIAISRYHVHTLFRDISSFTGLTGVLFFLLMPLVQKPCGEKRLA